MGKVLKFKWRYFVLALLIFIIEVLIALFAHDRIVRPYVGDFLVVILIYCSLRSFINMSVMKLAIFTLVFSYVIEILQYVDLLHALGLQDSALAKTVLGSSFEWIDLAAYTLGTGFVLYVEKTAGHTVFQRSVSK